MTVISRKTQFHTKAIWERRNFLSLTFPRNLFLLFYIVNVTYHDDADAE